MDVETAEALLREATGQNQARGALAWLAEGRPIAGSIERHELVAAVRMIDPHEGTDALRRLARELLTSAKDSSSDLSGLDGLVSGEHLDDVLAKLVSFSPNGQLSGVGPSALASAVEEHPDAVEVYLMCAAITWREARARSAARGTALPSRSRGPWQRAQLQSVVGLVREALTSGTAPIEAMTAGDTWAAIDRAQTRGVSYGHLLAQRFAGGTWNAHRSRTAGNMRRELMTELRDALDEEGIAHWASSGREGTLVPTSFLAEQVCRGDEAGQLVLVTRDDAGSPRAALLLAFAHDGGTARKTGSTLHHAPRQIDVPTALLLAGQGWMARGESTALFAHFDNRVFTDRHIPQLVSLLRTLTHVQESS